MPGNPTSLAWSADGRYLLCALTQPSPTLEEQKTSLWRLPLAGGPPEELALTMEGVRQISVRPDGQRLAFTAGREGSEVWVMEDILPKPAERTRPRQR